MGYTRSLPTLTAHGEVPGGESLTLGVRHPPIYASYELGLGKVGCTYSSHVINLCYVRKPSMQLEAPSVVSTADVLLVNHNLVTYTGEETQ